LLGVLPGENEHGGLVRAGRCGGAAPAQGRAEGPDAQKCEERGKRSEERVNTFTRHIQVRKSVVAG